MLNGIKTIVLQETPTANGILIHFYQYPIVWWRYPLPSR